VTELVGEGIVQADVPAQAVTLSPSPKPRPVQTQQEQGADPSLPARTTFQEDLTTAGQRQINLIWERTQSFIAVAVVVLTMVASIVGMMYNLAIPNLLAVAFGTVVGFYFSRTNHAAIGGVGPKPTLATYEGR